MTLLSRPAARRPGFTLIEVLVAAGLCMLIMAVLAEAFGAGASTFSLLKSTGELDGRLKTAQAILRTDLQLPHLEAETGEPVKVSQLRYDLLGTARSEERFARPQPKGFFRIVQETASQNEGTDPDAVPSTRAADHVLQMAVRYATTRADRVAVTTVPNTAWSSTDTTGLTTTTVYPDTVPFGDRLKRESQRQYSGTTTGTSNIQYAGRWAEVAYFLKPTNQTASGGLPMHALYRRVRVLTEHDFADTQLAWGRTPPTQTFQQLAPGMSCSGNSTTKPLNGPKDITNPRNRLGGMTATRFTGTTWTLSNIDEIAPCMDSTTTLPTGEDLVLTNVLSFEVKASWDGSPAAGGGDAPFDDIPTATHNTTLSATGKRFYDTWTTQFSTWGDANPPTATGVQDERVPLRIRMKAVQIKIRLYDPKNKLTRQMTFVQDL